MADEVIENAELDSSLAKGGIGGAKVKEVVREPIYKMIGESRLPVSKKMGKVWQSRKDQVIASRKDSMDAWREAIRYYDNDQLDHRTQGNTASAGNMRGVRGVGTQFTETENIVFANTSTM
jgi:hypothetical protein